MRTWARAERRTQCGNCGHWLEPNTPMMLIKLASVERPLTRCADCVGLAPPDLPELVIARTTKPMQKLSTAARGIQRLVDTRVK